MSHDILNILVKYIERAVRQAVAEPAIVTTQGELVLLVYPFWNIFSVIVEKVRFFFNKMLGQKKILSQISFDETFARTSQNTFSARSPDFLTDHHMGLHPTC